MTNRRRRFGINPRDRGGRCTHRKQRATVTGTWRRRLVWEWVVSLRYELILSSGETDVVRTVAVPALRSPSRTPIRSVRPCAHAPGTTNSQTVRQ